MPSMAPNTPEDRAVPPFKGPHTSVILVAESFMFEHNIQRCLRAVGADEAREDYNRLHGVGWIDSVRKQLLLPVRTYNTACVYYHKFRLSHADNEYDVRDAAAAALFSACKIEDTLKKSRDILCAAYNLNRPVADHLSPDSTVFDSGSRTMVSLERRMLEASRFDFRDRHPQKPFMKMARRAARADRATVGYTGADVLLDAYRTFAPLKQTKHAMALAALELAARIWRADLARITEESGFDYAWWGVSRAEVVETLLDLLDLYTHHRTSTLVGARHPLDLFIDIRKALNAEVAAKRLPRYTVWRDDAGPPAGSSPATSPTEPNGALAARQNGALVTPKSISPQSPAPAAAAAATAGSDAPRDRTVRFITDPQRARDEKRCVEEFFRIVEIEEYV